MDPATGLVMRTEQFDPDDLDVALARFDEFVAAESAELIPPNRAVLAGGLANLRARHPQPNRFIDGLADDITATLPDRSAVTVDDLRAGTVTPTDLGFGVTDRELIAVRGERLALLRVEDARWSIEETDEHDQLVRVTMFAEDDLDGAMARFAEISERPEPTSVERWQRELTAMINERRLDEFEARLAEGFTDDSRRTGYSFVLDRDQSVTGLHVFVEQGLSIENLGVVATAGDLGGLYRCEVAGDDNVSSFLQIGVCDADGNLLRTIEFDDDALDDALAELGRISAEPVTVLDPPTT
jgi:hypothetical protein